MTDDWVTDEHLAARKPYRLVEDRDPECPNPNCKRFWHGMPYESNGCKGSWAYENGEPLPEPTPPPDPTDYSLIKNPNPFAFWRMTP